MNAEGQKCPDMSTDDHVRTLQWPLSSLWLQTAPRLNSRWWPWAHAHSGGDTPPHPIISQWHRCKSGEKRREEWKDRVTCSLSDDATTFSGWRCACCHIFSWPSQFILQWTFLYSVYIIYIICSIYNTIFVFLRTYIYKMNVLYVYANVYHSLSVNHPAERPSLDLDSQFKVERFTT